MGGIKICKIKLMPSISRLNNNNNIVVDDNQCYVIFAVKSNPKKVEYFPGFNLEAKRSDPDLDFEFETV